MLLGPPTDRIGNRRLRVTIGSERMPDSLTKAGQKQLDIERGERTRSESRPVMAWLAIFTKGFEFQFGIERTPFVTCAVASCGEPSQPFTRRYGPQFASRAAEALHAPLRAGFSPSRCSAFHHVV
jgi:hypothetical protein